MKQDITIEDMHWAAGILEGEAGISMSDKYRPQIALEMCDYDIVHRMSLLLKRPFYTRPGKKRGYKRSYTVISSGYQFVDVTEQFYHLFGERRREQIDECLAKWNARPVKRARRNLHQQVGSLIASTRNKRFTLKQVVDGVQPIPLLHNSRSAYGTLLGQTPEPAGSNSTSIK